jgi:hypothetical protein
MSRQATADLRLPELRGLLSTDQGVGWRHG